MALYGTICIGLIILIAGFSSDNSVSFPTDDAGYVGAAVLAHVACVVGLQTNDARRNRKGAYVRIEDVVTRQNLPIE